MEPSSPLPQDDLTPAGLRTNPQLELAAELIRHTNKSLFLTGKAGSGKTTFLRQVRQEALKRMAIVAPTGVAAINAGGMTIHSLFQIPFGYHLPGLQRTRDQPRRMSSSKLKLIRNLDLLVIDEISMVRADLLDAVDEALRIHRHNSLPFGGVQLLMIGDLHQLPPVIKPDEWSVLSQHYDSPFFFSSQALQQTDYQSIELKKIYRQSDPEFIDLLNKVRNNCLDRESLQKLNSRYVPGFQAPADEPYITLTSTNAVAHDINASNLRRLSGAPQIYTAQIDREFPPSFFPTELNLEFKPGAQVMFIKNDSGHDRRYYNGKIGQISRLSPDAIYVTCPGESVEILVTPAQWQNVKYAFNEETKQIEEQVLGTFTQIPLKLAWAITIHKSQGLTFERAIIDAQSSFASGQVYVALSRCKSFEGIVLRTPLAESSVKTDRVVKQFSEEADRKAPTAAYVLQARREFESGLLRELFNFNKVQSDLESLQILYRQHAKSLSPETVEQLQAIANQFTEAIFSVAKKFAPQLEGYLSAEGVPSENQELQQRLQKGAAYFLEKIQARLPEINGLPTQTDNLAANSSILQAINSLCLRMFIKLYCFQCCRQRFNSEDLQLARANAELDYNKLQQGASESQAEDVVPAGLPHPDLYRQLLAWRQQMARQDGCGNQAIFPNATLRGLVQDLPIKLSSLQHVSGIGKKRLQRFGQQLCDIIGKYCAEQGVAQGEGLPRTPTQSSPTQQLSFELFRAGKTIAEIAAERKFALTTIEGHLVPFVARGELDVLQLINAAKLEEISQHVHSQPDRSLSEWKVHFGDKFSYGELKLTLAHLQRQQSQSQDLHRDSSRLD